jgi:hypothetical protein
MSTEDMPTRDDAFPSEALVAEAKAWWSTVAECQHELGRFVSDRLAKDGESLRQSLTCRDWMDALNVQVRWTEETLRDYGRQMSKLTELCAAASSAARNRRRTS